MTFKRLGQILAVVLTVACCAAEARAGIVKYTIGNGGLETFDVKMDGTSSIGILAGGISLSQNPSGNNTSMPASYVTVCTDIGATLYLGNTYKYNTPANNFSGLTGVDPTWGAVNTPAYLAGNSANTANASQAIQNAAYLFYTYGNLQANHTGISGSVEQLAALQLAIWSVLYNTTVDGTVTSGAAARFQITGGSDAAAISDANSWITTLNSQANVGNFGYLGYLLFPTGAPSDPQGNADGQPPQELLIDQDALTAVPEASTVLAGVLLLLPVGASALRAFRKHRVA